MVNRLNRGALLPVVVLTFLAGCGEAETPEKSRPQPAAKVEIPQPKLSAAEAKQLASDTLAYLNKHQKAMADDAVMNKDALLRVFNGPEFRALAQRWPAPFTGNSEAEKYAACQNLIVSANGYAHAQHDFAFNGLPEKDVVPAKRQYKEDLKNCKTELAA
ncbi:hypothetical protein [Pandoraea pnomenusa]|uniref:hypothetical protein n=1 Tax=Pandoraea pnomenusa TaxID=93220 RepID=UPI00333FD385